MTNHEITLHAIEIGRQAWKRIKEDSSYNDWMAVGEALDIGRSECMRLAFTNEPRGRAYNEAFSRWLGENGFADIDKGTRSRLDEIMKNRPAIEAWRATLASNERQRINHPSSIWRKWQSARSVRTSESKSKPVSKIEESKIEIVRLQEEIERMRANGGEAVSPKDSARNIARYWYEVLSESKFEEMLKIGKQLLDQQNAAMREGRDAAKAKVLRGE
jgi:hypothetical protein